MRWLILLLTVVMVAWLSGCRPVPSAVEGSGLSSTVLSTHLSRVTPADTDSLGVLRQSRYVASRFREIGLQPVAIPSYRLFQHGPPHILGIQTGRDAQIRSRAVMVTAKLGDPATAALLEAAKMLIFESEFSATPGATLLWTVWVDAHSGITGFLRHAPWSLGAIDHVLIISSTPERDAFQIDQWEEAGLTASIISLVHGWPVVEDGSAAQVGATYQLAEETIGRIKTVASGYERENQVPSTSNVYIR